VGEVLVKRHRVGQTWIRNDELRICLDPEEGRYVTLMEGGDVWEWTLEERLCNDFMHRDLLDFWYSWEDIT
jgi:hypothetical protein